MSERGSSEYRQARLPALFPSDACRLPRFRLLSHPSSFKASCAPLRGSPLSFPGHLCGADMGRGVGWGGVGLVGGGQAQTPGIILRCSSVLVLSEDTASCSEAIRQARARRRRLEPELPGTPISSPLSCLPASLLLGRTMSMAL